MLHFRRVAFGLLVLALVVGIPVGFANLLFGSTRVSRISGILALVNCVWMALYLVSRLRQGRQRGTVGAQEMMLDKQRIWGFAVISVALLLAPIASIVLVDGFAVKGGTATVVSLVVIVLLTVYLVLVRWKR